jgi:hypothetical protein
MHAFRTLRGRAALAAALLVSLAGSASADEPEFTRDFRLGDCRFATTGSNPFFHLVPGYELRLEGDDDGEHVVLIIRVLNRKKPIDLTIDGEPRKIWTRVVEERESKDGELVEVSRNYFARCVGTGDVYYFGEDVDFYEGGEPTGDHSGAWLAGQGGAMPGIIMPATFLLGSRYYQEVAPGVAEDRAEHVAMGLDIDTEAGDFSGCAEVLETTPLEPGAESEKTYCPGVGIVQDGDVELVDYGFKRGSHDDD